MRLIHIKNIVVTSLSEFSAFKHSKHLLNVTSQQDALRTQDYFIVSLAMDYEAQVLTFDKKIWKKVKPHYKQVYYCSRKGIGADERRLGMKDESNDFISDLDICIA